MGAMNMNDLKTAKQFYQASLEHLNKANELHEKMEATERKTVALFSRFIDGTKSISGDVELVAKDNLKAIQQRDVLAVINSIVAMTMDSPSSLVVSFNFGTLYDGTGTFYVIAWENTEERETKLHEHADLSESNALARCIQIESKFAELIIEAKDNAEVTA
ncbi:hypothetical protein, putative phage gene [Aliivibrio salmonicida LFI1238]|uniref:Uncharacterized protein n=2 Tax=Aliivibrio salmonicida TaxID=40269 RepID=B6EIQ5_ALISL|nr:hypothetical protein, putative phage gene [Aliivibrio salmonicida LFI1238]